MALAGTKLKDFQPLAEVADLQVFDVRMGDGPTLAVGAVITAHYTGALATTGQIFQSSHDFGEDGISFPLNGVIKGWTDGLPGMKIGGVRRLHIPAAMAYGQHPPLGSGIPPNADLVFDVELLAIDSQ